MARSAAEHVGGSPEQFYRWLTKAKRGAFPDGPPIWICGDCHTGNLGPLAKARGGFHIEIRFLSARKNNADVTVVDAAYWEERLQGELCK
jgi:uncharacterized protein (DUF2252 family)